MDRVDVVWANPGNPYPEVRDYMDRVKAQVLSFHEVVGQQPEFVAAIGHPVDVVPFEAERAGKATFGDTGPKLCSMQFCCFHNLWQPLKAKTEELRTTCLVRGEKESDVPRSAAQPGIAADGVEYFFPLWNWSDQDVLGFLGDAAPASYKRGLRTSLDCMNCTAHLSADPKRIQDLAVVSPATHAEVVPVLRYLRERLTAHLKTVNEALND
jgi:3'-phosphoadenosine 5'-phosphosulfate sulfotransferase (PAPS reductase)/FAD synthetase